MTIYHCETRGCPNIAGGIWKLETRRSTHYKKLCATCGFSAHSKRRMVFLQDDRGREYQIMPYQWKKVSLHQTLHGVEGE